MTEAEINEDYEWTTGNVILERFADIDPLTSPTLSRYGLVQLVPHPEHAPDVLRLSFRTAYVEKLVRQTETGKEMLEKDKMFIKGIHDAIGHYETEYSQSGKLPSSPGPAPGLMTSSGSNSRWKKKLRVLD